MSIDRLENKIDRLESKIDNLDGLKYDNLESKIDKLEVMLKVIYKEIDGIEDMIIDMR
tara:strand:- start:53 stop:226 length:174 start_codon:yes stop_codon:yes gene_type:complete